MSDLIKAKLQMSLAERESQIKDAVHRLSNTLTEEEWNKLIKVIFELRAKQADLQMKLKSLDQPNPGLGRTEPESPPIESL